MSLPPLQIQDELELDLLDDVDCDDTLAGGISIGVNPSNVISGSGSYNNSFIGGSSSGGSFAYSHGFSHSIAPPVVKTSIQYVVVLDDGHTLELDEQQSITAREMIGITKFLNMVMTIVMTQSAGANVVAKWSELINNLGIQRHFTAGMAVDQYDEDSDVLYVFLTDPK